MDNPTETTFTDEAVENALHRGEFRFHYQPKVSFLTGKIVGGEALLRWIRPDGTQVFPDQFLPRAEETGFITDITAVMVQDLIEDIETLRAVKPDVQVAFNISAKDLKTPYLVKILRSAIGNRRIDPGNIQIEVTETAVVDADNVVLQRLFDLVALGVEIVMDDFGTGYSSLDVLSRLPFSALKLDQGVVRRMPEDVRNTHIVLSSLYMARELSIKTIAEGVETEGTYSFLMASGCSEVQGYWIGKAMPLDDFISFFEEKAQWPFSAFGHLYNAWDNHISYRRKVLDYVHTLSFTSPKEWNELPKVDLFHSPARCRLGQWYMGERGEEGSQEHYARLDSHHRLMHEAGETLIETARSGKGPAAVAEATGIFLKHSDIVDAEVSRIVERWMARCECSRKGP